MGVEEESVKVVSVKEITHRKLFRSSFQFRPKVKMLTYVFFFLNNTRY